MNALILSAVFGVIMMFSGIWLKQKAVVRGIALAGVFILVVTNILEMNGLLIFKIDTKGMIIFDRFALLFDTIAFVSTFLYLTLSAKDMEKLRMNYAEFFALIFILRCRL